MGKVRLRPRLFAHGRIGLVDFQGEIADRTAIETFCIDEELPVMGEESEWLTTMLTMGKQINLGN